MRGSKHPFSWLALLGILLACGIAASLLIPNDEKVLDRLIRDGNYPRALQYLQSLSPAVVQRHPVRFKIKELVLKGQLLEERKKAAVLAHFDECLRAYELFLQEQAFLKEAVQTLGSIDDPESVPPILDAHPALPSPARYALFEALVQKALALAKPGLAAALFEHYWDGCGHRERVARAEELVRLWRGANEPARALSALERYEKSAGRDLFSLSPDLGELKVTLLREVGRPEVACQLLRAYIAQRGYGAVPPRLVQIMLKTAAESDLQDDLVPDFRKIAAERPRDTNVWETLGQLAVNASMLDDATNAYGHLLVLYPDSIPYLRQQAQLYEWKDQPNLAFDLNLTLARRGDLEALDNLRELNPGLYRGRDLLEAMRGLGPAMFTEKYRIPMAEILIEHGQYEESEKYLEAHLADHPGDVPILRKYADVLVQEFKYPKLLPVQLKLRSLLPEDEEIRSELAELYYLLGDFDRSFETYLDLLNTTTNLETIESCATLAQALGEFEQYTRCVERRIAVLSARPNGPAGAPKLSPTDYADLGDSYLLRGNPSKQAEVLEAGIKAFPMSETLRKQLAFVLTDLKRFAEGARVLDQHPRLRQDGDLLQLYLNCLIESGQFTLAAQFVKNLPPGVADLPELAPLLGTIYEKNQNYSAAAKVYRRLYASGSGRTPSESAAVNLARTLNDAGENRLALNVLSPFLSAAKGETLKLAARIYGDLNQFREAEALQKRYLAENKDASYQDWGYLGDLYRSSGKRIEAQRAYEQAVALFGQQRKTELR